jgi:hypothetical protein
MADQERFESIAAQLRADRRWVRRIQWLSIVVRLTTFGARSLSAMQFVPWSWVF